MLRRSALLGWFRVRARALAAAVLAALATLGAASIVPHEDDCHEGQCIATVAPHDPSQHHVRASSTADDHPLHCVVCHWQRLLRPAAVLAQRLAPPAPDPDRFGFDAVRVPPLLRASQPPLRSPPDTRLFDV
jgi:hypothetical protein